VRSWSARMAPSFANSSVHAGPMNWLTLVMRVTFPVSFIGVILPAKDRSTQSAAGRGGSGEPIIGVVAPGRSGPGRPCRSPGPPGGLTMEWLLFSYPSWSTLVVRVVLGIIFFAHGAQKVLGWFGGYGLKGTVGYLTSTGLPAPVAYLVCFFELLGGV